MSWNWEEATLYYKRQGAPEDQTAVISLLREVQQEHGGRIPAHILSPIAQVLGTKETYLQAVIRRIPSLKLGDGHCLELCAGPNCGKHVALAVFAEKISRESGGKIIVKYVPCMRLCGKGPNIKWDGKLYHRADEGLLRKLMKDS